LPDLFPLFSKTDIWVIDTLKSTDSRSEHRNDTKSAVKK
jgi:hypothetical protein